MRADDFSKDIPGHAEDLPARSCCQSVHDSFDGVDYYETDVISVDAEGGPFQLVDTDRRVPFVFRSYVLFYGEDLLMSVPEYFIGTVYAWLAPRIRRGLLPN